MNSKQHYNYFLPKGAHFGCGMIGHRPFIAIDNCPDLDNKPIKMFFFYDKAQAQRLKKELDYIIKNYF